MENFNSLSRSTGNSKVARMMAEEVEIGLCVLRSDISAAPALEVLLLL
jgi:hypothetical protein